MSPIAKCEKFLAEQYGFDSAILTGSGTVALALACRYHGIPDRKKVVIPAISCPNVAYACIYAEKKPIYVDVAEDTLAICPEKLHELLTTEKDISAIILVHLYGIAANIDVIKKIAKLHNIPIIEDACQAGFIKDIRDSKYIGAEGECTVLSFGHTKIQDVGGGGVLFLNNNIEYQNARNFNLGFSSRNVEKCNELSQEYRLYYYSNDKLKINAVASRYKDLFLYSPEESIALGILGSFQSANLEIEGRTRNWMIYYNHFSGIRGIKICGDPNFPSLWRFTFLVQPELRDGVLSTLRMKGFNASSWYPCIPDLFLENTLISGLEIARELEKRVINLWVKDILDADVLNINISISNYLGLGGVSE